MTEEFTGFDIKEEKPIEEPKPKPKPKKTLSEKDISEIETKIREARELLNISLKNRNSDGIDEAINILTDVIKKVK